MMKINNGMRYLAGAALLTISGVAAAQTSCSSTLSSYASAVSSGFLTGGSGSAQYIVSNHPQCFGGSVSAQASFNATSVAQTMAISNMLSNRLLSSGGPTQLASNGVFGMAAGAQIDKWNVWGNLTNNTTKVDYVNQGGTNTKNKNDILTTVIGADYALSPTMVFGLSGAFDNGDGSTTSGANPNTSLDTRGYMLAPYFGMQITKDLALDASVGFGSGRMSVGGDTKSDADRLFGGLNLSYSHWFQNIQLTGKLGYLHAEEDYGDSKTNGATNLYTKNKNKLDQFRAGVQVGYWMNGFMPYAGLAFTSDSRSISNQAMAVDVVGKSAALWTLGVNYFSLANKVTGGIAYNKESSRTNSNNDSLMANVSIRF